MTCEEVADRIDDYVDGLLSGAELHEVELHIASCETCREEERQIRNLIARAAALPAERHPARDLWPGIAARLDSDESRVAAPGPFDGVRRVAFHPVALAAAAAVAVALASVLVQRPDTLGSRPVPSGSVETVAATETPAPVSAAETEYIRATGQLMNALSERRKDLSPETVKAVDENLKTIDDAVRQIRDALHKDPGNRQLTKMLASTHQKKLDLLLRLLKLTSQI